MVRRIFIYGGPLIRGSTGTSTKRDAMESRSERIGAFNGPSIARSGIVSKYSVFGVGIVPGGAFICAVCEIIENA